FQAAEGLAVDPAAARRLREEAQRRAEEQGAKLQLLDARKDLDAGHYDRVIATARGMMETRAGREQAMAVLADVQQALSRGQEPRARPATASLPARGPLAPRQTVPRFGPLPEAAPTPEHAALHVEFRTAVPEGVLTIWVDGREMVREPFAYYQRDGIFH